MELRDFESWNIGSVGKLLLESRDSKCYTLSN